MSSLRWIVIALTLAAAACGTSSSGDDTGDDDPSPDATSPGVDAPPGTIDAPPSVDAPPAANDPGQIGTWGVHEATASVTTGQGPTSVTIYSPSSDGGASPAAGPFPLVVVSTGFQLGRDLYDATCTHIASWGYLVVIRDYTDGNHQEKAAEITDIIDWALGAQSGIAGRIDATKIAAAGHSLGGKLSVLAGIEDSRIRAVVGWDPVDALPPSPDGSLSVAPERIDELDVPLVVIGETTDTASDFGMPCAPAADNYTVFFNGACAAPSALEVTIPGADHTDWIDSRDSCGLFCFFCKTGQTADATVLQISRRVTVAWLETHLRGAADYGAYLTTPGIGSPATVRGTVPGCN